MFLRKELKQNSQILKNNLHLKILGKRTAPFSTWETQFSSLQEKTDLDDTFGS